MTIQHDAYASGTHDTREAVVDEPRPDAFFSYQDLARLDEALTMASRETGLRFTLYLGDLGRRTRARAEELFLQSGEDVGDSVLVAVSPGQRVVEVVTGAGSARRLPDRACALAVLAMTNTFAASDLVGGSVNGLRQLADQAGRPARHRTPAH